MAKQLVYLYLIYELNAALDAGRKLGVDEVRQAAEDRRLVEFIRDELGETVQDLQLIEESLWSDVNESLAQIAGGIHGQEKRKFGVEKNGICLAIAYALETAARIYADTRDIVDPDIWRDIRP